MPSFSATERAPAGIRPVARSTSLPSAAAVSVSNRAATSSGASRNAACADGGRSPVTTERTVGPSGTSSTPTPASSAANSSSGGAHTRASAPSSRSRTASPASGSTSPRDPHVDNTTRISQTPRFPRYWHRPPILRQTPGLAASPPVRYRLIVAGRSISLPSLFRQPRPVGPGPSVQACQPRPVDPGPSVQACRSRSVSPGPPGRARSAARGRPGCRSPRSCRPRP